MSNPRRRLTLTTSIVLLVLSATVPAAAAGPIDAGLYTTYSFYNGFVTVDWVVCGQTHGWYGCYGSGSLGPFGNVGALIEGNPSTNGNTVTRDLYIVDVGTGTGVKNINLYIYKKVDTIIPPNDSVTVTLTKTVQLPLVGGTGASCFMAANGQFLFIGTNRSAQAVEVRKSNFAVAQLSEGAVGVNVSSITADKYGNVTVTQGNGIGNPPVFGFAVFGPNGELEEDGDGASYMLNTTTGLSTSRLRK
jgi:hypothetical protein